ncbi:hypothetical protein [Nostoc sp. FACHB-280]|uniref:hypothetical protein n=1 Tax=Nostoc sp. FACHB-280 TaxID=2692839 RepID=UPI00168A4226|nr:hypothetical protein [Nostoc sp. FACHB-280]MBD2498016.1 hypothetical protein [Nostoc sp. FACHB-280]
MIAFIFEYYTDKYGYIFKDIFKHNFFTMRSLLWQNLKLTIPTALAFTILGYAVSLPMSFLFHGEAAFWKFRLSNAIRIETQKLDELDRFQARVALGSTAMGIIIAQTVFIVHAFAPNHRQIKNE